MEIQGGRKHKTADPLKSTADPSEDDLGNKNHCDIREVQKHV